MLKMILHSSLDYDHAEHTHTSIEKKFPVRWR